MYLHKCLPSSSTSISYIWSQRNRASVLNRTNNKAYKSCKRLDPNCKHSRLVETIEHLFCECELYSNLLGNRLGNVLMQYVKIAVKDLVQRVELGQINIMFNIPHPSIMLHIYTWQICQKHSTASNAWNQKEYHLQNELAPLSTESDILAMITSTTWCIRRLHSNLQYVRFIKYAKAIETLLQLQEINLAWFDPISEIHAFLSPLHAMTICTYPLPTQTGNA